MLGQKQLILLLIWPRGEVVVQRSIGGLVIAGGAQHLPTSSLKHLPPVWGVCQNTANSTPSLLHHTLPPSTSPSPLPPPPPLPSLTTPSDIPTVKCMESRNAKPNIWDCSTRVYPKQTGGWIIFPRLVTSPQISPRSYLPCSALHQVQSTVSKGNVQLWRAG